MLREIELSSALRSHVSFPSDTTVSWILPTSKTDCKAVGTVRTWDCVCKSPSFAPMCPVHALLRHCAYLDRQFSNRDSRHCELPLFPTVTGTEASKAAVVSTVFELVRRSGLEVMDSAGSYLYGGHSFRTGGAHLLSSVGINPYKIQALGRWKSPLVIHYAMDGMHSGIADDLCREDSTRSEAEDLKPVLDRMESRLSLLESRPLPTATVDGYFVMNKATKCCHWILDEVYTESHDARTPCGWQYLKVRHSKVVKFPSAVTDFNKICSICLPSLRRQLQEGHLSDLD